MKAYWDVIVVGAGPAGLCAATTAAKQGLEVLVLDEQATPGGQIYKNIEKQPANITAMLGEDYQHGQTIVDDFHKSGATYLPQSIVWKLGHDGQVFFSYQGKSQEFKAERIIIATGAMERPQPFAGWTLPGVMGAGALDALFKGEGVIPSEPVILAGSGPIMLLVALHMKKIGVEVSHFFDTTPLSASLKSFTHLPRALRRTGYLLKGTAMLLEAIQYVGKYHPNIDSFYVEGDQKAEKFVAISGKKKIYTPAKLVLAHEGVIPRTEFSRQLRLDHSWDEVQRYWYPTVNEFGRTSSNKIFMAGDGAYVHGAVASEKKGELAGLAVAEDLGKGSKELDAQRQKILKELDYELAPRPFIDAMYPAPRDMGKIDDDTHVCRCEEVTAGEIRKLIKMNQTTPEMIKAISRVGMGPCQGRMCSCAVSEIVAEELGEDIQNVGVHNIRPPVRNVGLGELAHTSLLEDAKSKKEAA